VYKVTNTGIKAIQDVTGQINKKIKGTLTADDIEKELFDIQNNYAKTRKMNDYSKDGGSETRKRLISADVLADIVDSTGTIRTKGENGAKAQYKAKTIDGTEGLVRNLLKREGATVNPIVLRGKMRDDIMKSGLEGKALQTALNNIDGEIEGLMLRATPDGKIPLDVIHDAKISTTDGIDFNTDPFVKRERKSTAKSYKEIIEQTSGENIREINGEITKEMKVLELLDALDGKKVKGGKLGRYFSQIGGNIIGGAAGSVGGPTGSALGSIIGGEVAGKIKGEMLRKTFGKSIGSTIEKSGIITEASNKVKTPRLLLPAPKPGSPRSSIGSGPTINLPSKTQSSLDNAYSYNLGKRNTMYNTTKTTTNTGIKLKSNNNTSSITNKKNNVNQLPKGKGEILKSTPYKSALEALRSPEMKAKIEASNAQLRKNVAGKSNNLYHTTSAENIDSIIKNGLTTGNKARFEGVSFPNKISFGANEATASYYGRTGDVMIRTKTSYKPKDLELDLLAGGEGTYTTGKNIPVEMLEIKQGNKWIPLSEWNKAQGKTKLK
jgi:hypothetical protein